MMVVIQNVNGRESCHIESPFNNNNNELNFCNCVEKPEKFRTSTGFEPVISRYRCDALTN